MKRRNFIKYAAAGTVMPHFIPFSGMGKVASASWVNLLQNAMIETDRVLVLVRLDGGNDGLNTVVPIDQYDKLYQARPHVILPQRSLIKLDGQDKVALHPAMKGMRRLYEEGKVNIIQSVGYPNQDFSHFRSSDIWMSGADHDEVVNTGWAGRYLENEFPNFPVDFPNTQMPDPLSLEMGPRLSLTFQGNGVNMGMSVFDPSQFYRMVEGLQTPAPDTPAGDLLEHIRLIKRQSNLYGQRLVDAYLAARNLVAYPDKNNLAEQLAIVARLIHGGLKTRIYLVSISGFDTHDQQVEETDHRYGEHAGLLYKVSTAIESFMDDLKMMGLEERVIGMTFSEFGRRITSNRSLGTDHGAAAPCFLFGKPVIGGVTGENPFIPNNARYQDNIEMQYDFRSLYATLLKDWFCLESSDLQKVMLDEYATLPIIGRSGCVATSTREQNQQAGRNLISVFPNPTKDWVQFDLEVEGFTLIQLFDSAGRLVATPLSSRLNKGQEQLRYDMRHLPNGMYHVRLQSGKTQQTRQIVKQS